MPTLIAAAIQIACTTDRDDNLDRVEARVREAVARGARLVVLQEHFESTNFFHDMDRRFESLARPLAGNETIARFSRLAKETGCVLPVSFYERDGDKFYNSAVMIDADGRVLDLYRKSHIPNGPGYWEKSYFSDGDTGLKVYDTAVGRIGLAICWDQWSPETARVLALKGAEVIIYPTAIGAEPEDPAWDSAGHWQRVMQGHAGANCVPVIAANRIGVETGDRASLAFYGSSFITDHTGLKLAEADRTSECVITASLDLDAYRAFRRAWGIFRDRRPALYGALGEPTPDFLLPDTGS